MESLDDRLLQEILQPRVVDKLDHSKILELCRRINEQKIGGGLKAVRAAKNSLFAKDPVVQLHALTLLDALVSNCANIFHEFASERVVDDIIYIIGHQPPVANQEIANKLVTRLAQHIPLPSVSKKQFKRLSSKGDTRAYAAPTFSNDMDFQKTCRKDVQGLLNDLTSSSENEALHLQKWLESFSNKLLNRADGVAAQVQGLLESTGAVEIELHNVFNSFHGLSSSQFVENLVHEEDELEITNKDMKKPEQGMSSQSYEDDIVPRYKEAVTSAWRIYEKHIWKPSTQILSSRTQVPHIIGTEDFMRDNSCGLSEDRSLGFEALDSESDDERDGAAEITEIRMLSEEEWSGSESEVADEQIGGFKPSVSAALDFKAMLEAALRSPYVPQKADAFPSKRTTTQHLDGNLVPTIQGSMASMKIATAITTTVDQIQRSVSKQGHGALQSCTSLEPDSEDGVSTLLKVVSKPIPPEQAEIQNLRKEPSSEEETTTMISNDVLRDFRTSMTSGGLFDDENEDSHLFGSQSANIWSHTTRTCDASDDKGTHIEKHEEQSFNDDDILVSESRASWSPKKPSFLAHYADNRNRFLNMKTAHILDKEKVLDAKSDNDVAPWSSSHSDFSTNAVDQQYGDELGVAEPPMTNLNSLREKTNEEPPNISPDCSRKLIFLGEKQSLQCTMSPPQQKSPKTRPNISVDDAFKEKRPQTQRPPLQATSQDVNGLHHGTMSRPRGPERREPPSMPPLLVTSNSPEEGAGGPNPDFVVQESDSIEKTLAFSRVHLASEN